MRNVFYQGNDTNNNVLMGGGGILDHKPTSYSAGGQIYVLFFNGNNILALRLVWDSIYWCL